MDPLEAGISNKVTFSKVLKKRRSSIYYKKCQTIYFNPISLFLIFRKDSFLLLIPDRQREKFF